MVTTSYNERPPFWREITDYEFGSIFFCYITKEKEFRQLFWDGNRRLTVEEGAGNNTFLFEISYKSWEGLGVAMQMDNRANKIRFFQYGDPEKWRIESARFAAQFAGDNS